MPDIALILGGCRSGKSRQALELAEQSGLAIKVFLATCQAHDVEMQDRISRHQQERGAEWITVEEPLHVPDVLQRKNGASTLILLDCLTLWVSNLMMHNADDTWVQAQFVRLDEALQGSSGPVVVVSNEVGLGVVPDNPMARRFRDLVGWLNQQVAARANRVVWMVAGVPLQVKG
ncbi:MAG: bifunctional adenosylcobinamide kinase/adenosylcobinamide-phosphate guanylyltransferase [Desulfovermiculus sp.]